MMSSPIRVVVADDHQAIRDGILFRIQNAPDLRIAATAASFAEVSGALAEQPVDVVVLDLVGMGAAPISFVMFLRKTYPQTAIIIFSSVVDLAPELIAAGASGYVTKEELTTQLVAAIRTVAQGEPFISPAVEQYLLQIESFRANRRLKPKEELVVKLLAQGLGTMDIAAHMEIDARSVQNYITAMFRKTGLTERTQLVEWYRRTIAQG